MGCYKLVFYEIALEVGGRVIRGVHVADHVSEMSRVDLNKVIRYFPKRYETYEGDYGKYGGLSTVSLDQESFTGTLFLKESVDEYLTSAGRLRFAGEEEDYGYEGEIQFTWNEFNIETGVMK